MIAHKKKGSGWKSLLSTFQIMWLFSPVEGYNAIALSKLPGMINLKSHERDVYFKAFLNRKFETRRVKHLTLLDYKFVILFE